MSYETIDPPTAKQRLDEGDTWTYLDVRTPEEFAQSRVPGSINIPVALRTPMGMQPNPEFVQAVQAQFANDRALVVACKMGGRSMRACEMLAAKGYTQLANMHGGFSGAEDQAGWEALGFPVER